MAPIYVETRVRGDLEALWRRTQEPEQHARWDLRFSAIDYLPRAEGEPQRFRYRTRIGLGLAIAGEGESVADRLTDGVRTSVLRFSSGHPLSLISDGSGYWRYVSTADGIRFLTRYDYRCRFGWAGRWFDATCFRPLLGWATAVSFDCLRRWVEDGTDPALSWLRWRVHATARVALALAWAWHGVVPKLIAPAGERALLTASGFAADTAARMVTAIGVGELVWAALLIGAWRRRWPLWSTLLALPVLAVGACVAQPALLSSPFGPVSLTLAMGALVIVALLAADGCPTAATCLRAAPPEIP